jgi:hypothetical protein
MDKAIQGKTTKRYLPESAWKRLTPEQRKETDDKKREGSRAGKQFVGNTEAAKKARKAVQASRKYRNKG